MIPRYASIAPLLPFAASAIDGSIPRPRPLVIPGVLSTQKVKVKVKRRDIDPESNGPEAGGTKRKNGKPHAKGSNGSARAVGSDSDSDSDIEIVSTGQLTARGSRPKAAEGRLAPGLAASSASGSAAASAAMDDGNDAADGMSDQQGSGASLEGGAVPMERDEERKAIEEDEMEEVEQMAPCVLPCDRMVKLKEY